MPHSLRMSSTPDAMMIVGLAARSAVAATTASMAYLWPGSPAARSRSMACNETSSVTGSIYSRDMCQRNRSSFDRTSNASTGLNALTITRKSLS